MPQTAASQATIVIAEDDEDLLSSYKLWLSKNDGWDVITASNGADALELLDEHVDVLITDRRMPGLNAEEIVNHLDEKGTDISIIIVSAYSPDSFLHEENVDAYLTKPVLEQKLIENVERLLADG